MELKFEAIKRVKFGDEHCWTASIEGSEVVSVAKNVGSGV